MTTSNRAAPLTFCNPCDQEVYDLHVTCSDNEIVYAHRQVLMSRCTCVIAPMRVRWCCIHLMLVHGADSAATPPSPPTQSASRVWQTCLRTSTPTIPCTQSRHANSSSASCSAPHAPDPACANQHHVMRLVAALLCGNNAPAVLVDAPAEEGRRRCPSWVVMPSGQFFVLFFYLVGVHTHVP